MKKRLPLSLGLSSNPRTWPVLDGHVTIDGAEAATTVMHPSEMFWRQLRFAEFDVCEMSMSSLLMATALFSRTGTAPRQVGFDEIFTAETLDG